MLLPLLRSLLAGSASSHLSSCQLHQLLLLKHLLMVKTLLATRAALLLLSLTEVGVEKMLLLLTGPVRRLLQKLLHVLASTAPSATESVAQ
jgi:hypothetical protein